MTHMQPGWDRDPYTKKTLPAPAPAPVDPYKALHNFLHPWTVGFDRQIDFFRDLEEIRTTSSYPPYNIIDLKNDCYEIQLAIAGYSKEEIDIEFKDSVLTVTGSRINKDDGVYLHRGIAARDFEQRFAVAEDVLIKGASLKDGFLSISLEREVPENKKARTIPIK